VTRNASNLVTVTAREESAVHTVPRGVAEFGDWTGNRDKTKAY